MRETSALSVGKSQPVQGILQGLGVGLAAGRLLIEGCDFAFLSIPWLTGLVACLAAGQGLVWWMQRRGHDRRALWALWLGVVWPGTTDLLFGLALVVGLLIVTTSARFSIRGAWPEVAIALAFLVLYIATLSPTVLPADSGEFQTVGAVLGIAHPPGYPLYTMLGWLFARLPLGDMAYRLNLFGAACGILTLAVVAHTVRRVSGSAILAAIAAGSLGLSTTFWAQSTTANIRSMTALFTALCVDLILGWSATRSTRRLAAFGLVFGLGIGHHSSLILLGLPFLAFILLTEPQLVARPRQWTPALAALVASFVVLGYIPLRSLAGASSSTSPIQTWPDFAAYVLALGFRGDMLYFREGPVLLTRAGIWANIVRLQFGPIVLTWILVSEVALTIRKWRLGLLLLGIAGVNVVAALTYRAPQTVEYLIPSYVAMALMLGLGLAQLQMGKLWRQVLAAWLAVVIAANGMQNYASFRSLHQDSSARVYAEKILANAPQNALILANWHRATPFWYMQQVEGLRPDVRVQYVYPEGALPNEQVWLRRIAEAIRERPVIVTNWFYAFGSSDYIWAPFHGAWLVRREPIQEPPEGIIPLQARFGDEIDLLGYALDTASLAPGHEVRLRIYWRPLRTLAQDYASFVQLLGPSGVLGQGDLAHSSREILPGQICVDTYQFPLLLQTRPGQYPLVTGFYYAENGGWQRLETGDKDFLALASIDIRAVDRPPVTNNPQSRQLVGGPKLVGIDWDRTIPGQTRVYLHWWQPRASVLGRAPAQGRAARVQIRDGDQVHVEAPLPALSAGSGATVVADIGPEAEGLSLVVAGDNGRPWPWAGPWGWPINAVALPPMRDDRHYIPLGGEMAFLGLDTVPAQAKRGVTLSLSPRFLSLRPLLADYTVSVGLRGVESSWESKSDGTPALGAIPTLKWVRGWVVSDPHTLVVPEAATPGAASVTLGVYDAFTLRPLNVLDDRLAQQGQGTHLELDTVIVE